jgi:hypothetical protein
MTEQEMNRQVESLHGQVICFRAYATGDVNKAWSRFAGKLEKARDGTYRITTGPEYNYLPLVATQVAQQTEPFPKQGLTYTRIVAAQVWVTEFAQNMYNENQRLRSQTTQQDTQAQPEDVYMRIAEVATWKINTNDDARQVQTWLALQSGYQHLQSPDHLKSQWTAMEQWLETAATLEGWQALQPFVNLGNSLVHSIRQLAAETQLRIPTAKFRAKLAESDMADDPVGRVIAVHHQGASRRPNAREHCTKCNRRGHLAEACYAKTRQGEGQGGFQKK